MNGFSNHIAHAFYKKKIQTIQEIAGTNAIVFDATGAITHNQLIVSRIIIDNQKIFVSGKGYDSYGTLLCEGKPVTIDQESALWWLAHAVYFYSADTKIKINERGAHMLEGHSIDAAFAILAAKMGLTKKTIPQFKKIDERIFDAHNKVILCEYNNKRIFFIVGSSEFVSQQVILNAHTHHSIQELQNTGLHTIAIAYKECKLTDEIINLMNESCTILGICGIEDAVRADALASINKARKAGLQVIMTSSHHQRTAIAIAKHTGVYKEGDEAIDTHELDLLSDLSLQEQLPHATVYSNMSDEQKDRVISALRLRGLRVIENDKKSQSFSSVIKMIEESRHIITTRNRLLVCFLVPVLAQLFLFIGALLYCKNIFLYSQVMLVMMAITFITSGFLMWALTFEKKDSYILSHEEWQTYQPKNRIFKICLISNAISMVLITAASFLLFQPYSMPLAITMSFAVFTCCLGIHALNCRSIGAKSNKKGLLGNKHLVWTLVSLMGAVYGILQMPIHHLTQTISLNPYQGVFALVVASSMAAIEWVRRWLFKRLAAYR